MTEGIVVKKAFKMDLPQPQLWGELIVFMFTTNICAYTCYKLIVLPGHYFRERWEIDKELVILTCNVVHFFPHLSLHDGVMF